MKKMLKYIQILFNATDLMEELIKNKLKVISFLFGLLVDVGKHEDLKKPN
jgi:hypothetical protein